MHASMYICICIVNYRLDKRLEIVFNRFFSLSVPRTCNGADAGMLQLIKYVNLSVKPARICLHKTSSTLRDVIYSTYYRRTTTKCKIGLMQNYIIRGIIDVRVRYVATVRCINRWFKVGPVFGIRL